jgi:glycosyltransferase involved in cell wall biosynthesis
VLVTEPSELSIVVTTYERPAALDVVLRALADQWVEGFEIVVADDGSGPETAGVVGRWAQRIDVRHLWQPNEGFLKARLLNRAVLATRGRFLVFLDGDCVPRVGFLRAVRRAALPGWFIASKRLHLSPGFSRRVVAEELPVWRWSSWVWLVRAPRELVVSHHRQANRPGTLFPLRDRSRPWRPDRRDFRPPYNGYGYALGVHREDLERVNGFDMRLRGWDGEDVDVAHRLRMAGLRCGWPGPDASVLHLWHTPGKQPASRFPRNALAVQAPSGLHELAVELESVS